MNPAKFHVYAVDVAGNTVPQPFVARPQDVPAYSLQAAHRHRAGALPMRQRFKFCWRSRKQRKGAGVGKAGERDGKKENSERGRKRERERQGEKQNEPGPEPANLN